MKKTVCILMLVVPMLILAQESSISITGGYAPNGFGAQASYNYSLSQKAYVQLAFLYSQSEDKVKDITIPYKNYSANIGYFYNVIQDNSNRFNLAIGGGAVLGYDDINNNESILSNGGLIDGKNKFVYGGFAGAETYYYLSDTFALLAVFNGLYHTNSDLGNTTIYGGFGIRITL
ncbi:MAG: conjugal transfer protein TraO [Cellulophaga sp.]